MTALAVGGVSVLIPETGLRGPVLACGVMGVVAVLSVGSLSEGSLSVGGLRRGHPHPQVGMANLVTLLRAAIAAVVASVLMRPQPIADAPELAWALVALVSLALLLDGVDGWLARRSGLASAFGARFDMEVDAFLAAVLCLVALHWGKAGVWLLPLGFLRYAWVLAGLGLPWLSGPLPDRMGRKTACVVQIAVLTMLMAPPLTPPLSVWLAGGAMAALVASFAVDALWLWRRR